ncbi:hypothetical protein GCM10027168_53900 [Streptomyces capparidis]
MADRHKRGAAALLEQMARGMAERAPKEWRTASLSATAHRGGGAHTRLRYTLADGSSHHRGDRRLSELVGRVHGADGYGADGHGADELAVEVAVDRAGRFEAVTSGSIGAQVGGGPGRVLVLRPGVRAPDAGDDQPGPANAAQAGDPREAVRLLRRYLEERARLLGRAAGDLERLPAPPEPARRQELERSLGVPLPDDLRVLYAVADGDGGDAGARLLDRHVWLSLSEVADLHRGEHWWALGDTWRYHGLDAVRHDPPPPAAVRRSADRPRWIPFADSTGGDFLAVDMDPARGGRPGQVIRIGRNHNGGPVLVADSVTSLLRRHLQALERGDHECDADGEELWIEAGLPEDNPGPVHASAVRAAAARLGEVQVLDAAGEADLEPLRGAGRLRRIRLAGGAPPDLAPLRDVPVESLELDLDTVDLGPLDGHPALRAVTVASARPVSVAPLRNCPRLYGLDLSRAAVPDLAAVAGMAGLLYLALRHEQWVELWERTGPPPGLAAAVLAGEPSPGELARWAALFGDGCDLRYHSGRLAGSAEARGAGG